MNNYDFSTLNDRDFEVLAKDLLSAKFKLDLQDFKVGRDNGIDLRFSTPKNNNSIVVQAKHYLRSSFSQLKYELKTSELQKVRKLKPESYFVVTSLPLSAAQKDEIKDLLTPFVLSSNNVIGREDLNGYLREFKEVEKAHFKLWFSSVNVLETIINNAIEGRTRFLLKEIKRKIPFYVVTKKLDDANKILERERLLLITGQPGIGKTTLAEIMVFEWAMNGYTIHEIASINEAEQVFSLDDDKNELFYFDDFLGENYLNIINRTETQIPSFVNRIRSTPNKYLILTTRTVVLNQAVQRSEKISRSNLASDQFELKLSDYSKYEKAKILYNHLYFNEVREHLYNNILHEKFYNRIIEHTNYMPRLMEFITDKSRINDFSASEYKQFIQNNLNNPKEIWRHSFNNQIGYFERCLLLTLFTFNRSVSESVLREAFSQRLDYERREHNQVINSNQFNDSIRVLLNGFITSTINDTKTGEREYTFINPSLTDFLINYFLQSPSEREATVTSIVFFQQLERFGQRRSPLSLEKLLQTIIRDKFARQEIRYPERTSEVFEKNRRFLAIIKFLLEGCRQVDIETLLLENLKKIDFAARPFGAAGDLFEVLGIMIRGPEIYAFIRNNFIEIIEAAIGGIYLEHVAEEIPELFDKYGQDFQEYQNSENGAAKLADVIEKVADSIEEDLKYTWEDTDDLEDLYEVEESYSDLETVENNLCSILLPNDQSYDSPYYFDHRYWEEKIQGNFVEKKEKQADASHEKHYKEADLETGSEDEAIDDLFSR